jgi:hypothetical protein
MEAHVRLGLSHDDSNIILYKTRWHGYIVVGWIMYSLHGGHMSFSVLDDDKLRLVPRLNLVL